MEIYDGDVADFTGRFAADRGVHARFYTVPVQDKRESSSAGRPIFRDTEFIEIVAAGNANNVVRRKATNEDKQRFPRQYEAYRQGAADQIIGTPLTEVPWITRSQVEELAYIRIRSLEELAHVDDNVCARMAGLYDLKRKAKAAMDAADAAAPLTELQAKNEQLKNELAALKDQLAKLTSKAAK